MSAAPRLTAEPGPAGWGVRLTGAGWALVQDRPVAVAGSAAATAVGYESWEETPGGGVGRGRVPLGAGAVADVVDRWSVVGEDAVVDRLLVVVGSAPGAFGSRLTLRRAEWSGGWCDVVPFVPGVTYGDAEAVAAGALGGLPARRAGARAVLVREDRMAAPVLAVAFGDGPRVAIAHLDPGAATTAADCVAVTGGDLLTDGRLTTAALGGVAAGEGLELGLWFPGSEGEYTYSSGGLPLTQPHAWRHRFHPVRDGLRQEYRVAFRLGRGGSARGVAGLADLAEWTWRRAWEHLRPRVVAVDVERAAALALDVLADRVTTTAGRTGVALEADAVDPADPGCATVSVMGFVGAATDAGYLLLRRAEAVGGDRGADLARTGEAILDTFAGLPLDPPAGEGFDTVTGGWATYRELAGRPAVFARSVAEGCLATLRAEAWSERRGTPRPAWRAWWLGGAAWLTGQQGAAGQVPRAWEAGTGAVLDPSPSSAAVVVPFLVAAARRAGRSDWLDAAVAAAEHSWTHAERTGCFAGATLDNPDVVDKEAAVLAAEGYVALHEALGDRLWLERALVAARLAETWVYLWDVPMPSDADPAALHWKPGVPTTGHQLIVTGASMTDGFLAVNAALFARLWRLTGDPHWREVARLVTHGTMTMLAVPGRTFDLRGPGWQQEHWAFGGRRGFGLNRRWLPWVAVAHGLGAVRVADLGEPAASAVLGR